MKKLIKFIMLPNCALFKIVKALTAIFIGLMPLFFLSVVLKTLISINLF